MYGDRELVCLRRRTVFVIASILGLWLIKNCGNYWQLTISITTCTMLKPIYSFGEWWKWKISLIGFVYRVVWVLQALWIFLSETINFLRKLHKSLKLTFLGCPPKFYHSVMYIAPSRGHISLNFNMPFKLILRRFQVVFWCLEWECCTFWKIDGNSFKSTNTILWL